MAAAAPVWIILRIEIANLPGPIKKKEGGGRGKSWETARAHANFNLKKAQGVSKNKCFTSLAKQTLGE